MICDVDHKHNWIIHSQGRYFAPGGTTASSYTTELKKAKKFRSLATANSYIQKYRTISDFWRHALVKTLTVLPHTVVEQYNPAHHQHLQYPSGPRDPYNQISIVYSYLIGFDRGWWAGSGDPRMPPVNQALAAGRIKTVATARQHISQKLRDLQSTILEQIRRGDSIDPDLQAAEQRWQSASIWLLTVEKTYTVS